MSANYSASLALPFMASGQAQKHITHNEALLALDALTHLTILDRDLAAPPASPDEGDRYLVAASPTGAWSGQAGRIAAFQDGAWSFYTPRAGFRAWAIDETALLVFDGAAWSATPDFQNLDLIGIGATADSTTRLIVASAASLFTHAGAGHQHKINKAASSDTASLLFQTGFSGRAELGLAGDDHLHIKVSADGSAWKDALVIDNANARVGVGTTAPTSRLTVSENAAALPTPPTGTQIHLASADGAASYLVCDAFGAAGNIFFRRAQGTAAAPSALTSGLGMGGFGWGGYGATAYQNNRVSISPITAENWTDAAQGCELRFFTTALGAAATSERLRIKADGSLTHRANAFTLFDANSHLGLRSYVVAGLPSASVAGQMIFVSNESGGAVPAFSDGTNWRRVTDRNIVS